MPTEIRRLYPNCISYGAFMLFITFNFLKMLYFTHWQWLETFDRLFFCIKPSTLHYIYTNLSLDILKISVNGQGQAVTAGGQNSNAATYNNT